MRVVTRFDFRPTRSPGPWPPFPPTPSGSWPAHSAATYSATTETGSACGKNCRPNTRAAADPKWKKSYHSMAVPTKLAATTRSTGVGRAGAGFIARRPGGQFASGVRISLGLAATGTVAAQVDRDYTRPQESVAGDTRLGESNRLLSSEGSMRSRATRRQFLGTVGAALALPGVSRPA